MKRTSHDTSRFTLILYKSLVGYTTVQAPVGSYVMVGGQFTSTLGEPVDLQDFIKGSFTAVDFDDPGVWYATSPVVLLHNGVDFDWYYYQTDAQGTGDSPDGWVDAGANYAEGITIQPGQGFWFGDFNAADGSSVSVTFAGQVPGDETGYTLTVVNDAYNMIANPLPIEVPINSDTITWGGLTAVDFDDPGEWYATSPVVLLHNGVDFDWYYYQTDAQGTGDSPDGWVDAGANYAEDTVAFKVAKGCWFRNPAGGTVQIKFAR